MQTLDSLPFLPEDSLIHSYNESGSRTSPEGHEVVPGSVSFFQFSPPRYRVWRFERQGQAYKVTDKSEAEHENVDLREAVALRVEAIKPYRADILAIFPSYSPKGKPWERKFCEAPPDHARAFWQEICRRMSWRYSESFQFDPTAPYGRCNVCSKPRQQGARVPLCPACLPRHGASYCQRCGHSVNSQGVCGDRCHDVCDRCKTRLKDGICEYCEERRAMREMGAVPD
jgi:hypothetical protein